MHQAFCGSSRGQTLARMVTNRIRQKVIYQRRRNMQKNTPCKITKKWVVKKKELELIIVNMVDKQFSPLHLVTRNRSGTQAQSNDFGDVQVEFYYEDSRTQSTRGSSSHWSLSSIHPQQFVVYMANDDGESDQDTEDNRSNNGADIELFDAVKQNSLKIKLLKGGQNLIMK